VGEIITIKVFIGWSKRRGKKVAELLKEYLPLFIQAVEPWMSEDIEKGAISFEEIKKILDKAKIGIMCITKENLESPWIYYETGRLSYRVKVCGIVLDLLKEKIPQPLSYSQLTDFSKKDFIKLLSTINQTSNPNTQLPQNTLIKNFNTYWPQFRRKLRKIRGGPLLIDKPQKDIQQPDTSLSIIPVQESFPEAYDQSQDAQKMVTIFYSIRSESALHFTELIKQNFKENENLPGLSSNKIRIKRIKIQSLQNLIYEIQFWKKDTFENRDLNLDSFSGSFKFEESGRQIHSSHQYYFDSGLLDIMYEDLDGSYELHVSIVNRSGKNKKAGKNGAIILDIDYEPSD
jgi:hypothetical protein